MVSADSNTDRDRVPAAWILSGCRGDKDTLDDGRGISDCDGSFGLADDEPLQKNTQLSGTGIFSNKSSINKDNSMSNECNVTNNSAESFAVEVRRTDGFCPIGETVGKRNIEERRIPVLSCEGGCIRGEIARLAANMVSKEAGFARGCHGELVTVPDSAIAQWIHGAEKVVLIDGCFLSCHGRILEGLLEKGQLVQFDALRVYRKYTDVFDVDDVPEPERKQAARQVADSVLAQFRRNGPEKILKCGGEKCHSTSKK